MGQSIFVFKKVRLFGSGGKPQVVNGVLIGQENELFLATGAHNVLDFATGKRRPERKSVENLARNLNDRRVFAEKNGVSFVHLIAPEKYRVYPDKFPIKDPLSLAEQYAKNGCEGMIDPVAELRAEQKGRTYGVNDTHWAAHGKIVAARLIARSAGIPEAEIFTSEKLARSSLRNNPKPFAGDLGSKLVPPLLENTLLLELPFEYHTIENGISHLTTRPANDGRLIYSVSKAQTAAKKRLLIFGDSYLHLTLSTLSFFFTEVLFCRTRWFHPEVVMMFQPDAIVTQQAERYLSYSFLDSEAPNFFLVPFLLNRQPAMTREEAMELSKALSCGRQIDNSPLQG